LIFVDTSFWVAARLRGDRHHAEAVQLLERFDGETFVTSNAVRGETWTFLLKRAGHRNAVAYLDMLEGSERIRLDPVSEALEREALAWLRRHDERDYSFVDATSFALMRSLRINEVLAFDGDFTPAGFVELRAD
jgi:uncharacterized protein